LSRHHDSDWSLSTADLREPGVSEAFDRITRLAARLLRVPVSYISLAEDDRMVFISEIGLPPRSDGGLTPGGFRTARAEQSICHHVVATGKPLILDDVRSDPCFAQNARVASLEIGAYIGLPVTLPDGTVAGSLCAVDTKPRQWSEEERATLEDLLAILATELSWREEVERRRRLEQNTRLLSREMEHRIKNSLSTIQAIILLSVREGQNALEIRSDLLERVASVAKTQSLLADQDGQGAIFTDIVRAELQHFGIGTNVVIRGPDVFVGKDDTVTIGMILHELATNATKHGALAPRSPGGVTVEWEFDEAENRIRLEWRERLVDGQSATHAQNGAGFGTELLETLVLRQMRGTMERDWTSSGLFFRAELKLADPKR